MIELEHEGVEGTIQVRTEKKAAAYKRSGWTEVKKSTRRNNKEAPQVTEEENNVILDLSVDVDPTENTDKEGEK